MTAKPYVPAGDDVVLERLPEKLDPSLAELKRLRLAVAQRPGNLDLAARLARRAIEASRETGDPRFLGQAQAALKTWWDKADAPREVLVLRATIRQSLHDFPAALTDLDRVLKSAPDDAQARLTRGSILTVVGRYDEALTDCEYLTRHAPEIVVVACAAAPRSARGDGARVYTDLNEAIARAGRVTPGVLAWAHTLAGEIAARSGDPAAAEQHFRRALLIDPRDPYLRGAFADFLLDQRRAREAAALVVKDTTNDALLLRLALAEAQFDQPTMGECEALAEHRAELAARFAASRARGDVVHRREEARYMLHLQGNARGALALARANWEVQREPADLRILAEAAQAAGDTTALDVVRSWQQRHAATPAARATMTHGDNGAAS